MILSQLLSLCLFVAAFGAARSQGQDSESTPRPPLGRHLNQYEDLAQASGLAMDDDGRLWVLESQAGRLWRIQPGGERELLHGELGHPMDVERGTEGELFVTDANAGKVWRLDAEGEVLGQFDVPGTRPSGLAWNANRLYVCDVSTHRVEVFSAEGEPLFGFGGHGVASGQLISPADVAVGEDGTIFVADAGNSRVQVFDAKGEFLREFGDWGPFPGLFFRPSGIEVRGAEVYVSDFGNHRVQVFDAKGQLLDRFGLHAIRPREGKGYIHYPSSLALSPSAEFAAVGEPWVDRVQVFSRTGGTAEDAIRRQAMQLAKPSAHYGKDFACAGEFLFISEPESHTVVVFENSGDDPRRISRLGGLGSKTGLLTGVGGLHYAPEEHELWVADPILRRLSHFRLPGIEQEEVGFDALLPRFVKSVDLQKLHALELSEKLAGVPEVIAIEKDSQGRLYLLDALNATVLVLSPDLTVAETFGSEVLHRPRSLVVTADGGQVFVADAAGALWRFDGEERKSAEIGNGLTPHGLVLDEKRQYLFVSDPVEHMVYRVGLAGQETVRWGGAGLRQGEFYKPTDLAFDHRGHLLVLDHGNHRIVRMTVEGEYQACVGPRLYTRYLRYPKLADKELNQEDGE